MEKSRKGEGVWISSLRFLLLSSAIEGSLVVSYGAEKEEEEEGYCDPTSNVNWRKEEKESPEADTFIGVPRHAERCLRSLGEVKT